MRASGVTTLRFCLWLGTAGVLLAALMFVVGEYVAPPLGQYARQMKVFAKFQDFSLAANRGTWVRDGDTIISVDQQSASTRFGGIKVFMVDRDHHLLSAGRAETAQVARDKVWRLDKYSVTTFDEAGSKVRRNSQGEVRTSLSPEFLGLAIAEPDTMGLHELREYIAHLQRNDLQATQFQTAFWARLARMFAVVVVIMLSLPFSTGSLRNAGQGARTILGVMIGAGFVFLSQMLENSGELFNLEPWMIGWLPTALLSALTGTLLWRNR
jgi:lipopolysaccharide export system permease protein